MSNLCLPPRPGGGAGGGGRPLIQPQAIHHGQSGYPGGPGVLDVPVRQKMAVDVTGIERAPEKAITWPSRAAVALGSLHRGLARRRLGSNFAARNLYLCRDEQVKWGHQDVGQHKRGNIRTAADAAPFSRQRHPNPLAVRFEEKPTASNAASRLRTHSQKSTVAASAMADRKTVGHRS
jgi:hypothetical protein